MRQGARRRFKFIKVDQSKDPLLDVTQGGPNYEDGVNPSPNEERRFYHVHNVAHPYGFMTGTLFLTVLALMIGIAGLATAIWFNPTPSPAPVSIPDDASFGVLNVTQTLDLQGTCVNPIDPTCIPAVPLNTTCVEPLDDACIPSNITVDHLVVNQKTTLNNMVDVYADVICATPIWPSCLDISAQSCMAGMPLQDSCIPKDITLDSLEVSNTAHFDGLVTCSIPMSSSCMNTSSSSSTLSSDIICDATLDTACIDISNEACPGGDLDINCIPTDLAGRTLSGTTALTGALTCSGSGSINSNCVDISGETCPGGPLNSNCIDISNEACPMGDLDIGCIPTDLSSRTLSGPTSLTGALTCLGAGAIDANCIDISGETCPGGALALNCLDISGHGTCSSSIDASCVDISGETCPGGPLDANCIDISGETCPGGALNSDCIPSDLFLDSLVVFNLTVLNENVTFMGTTDADMLNVDMLMSNNTIFKGPVTCTAPDLISPVCIDISGETCTTPISPNCVDISGEVCSTPVSASCVDISNHAACTMPIDASCVDISGESCPGGALAANCIDISNEACPAGALSENCIPSTIDSTTFSGTNALTGSFTCTGAGAINSNCVDISGETCTMPVDISCLDISNHGTCSASIDETCLPSTIDSTTFSGSNSLTGPLTCSGAGVDAISQSCYDISNHGTCSASIDETCLPSTIDSTTFSGSNSLTGPLTCSGAGANGIADGCLPATITVDTSLTCSSANVIDQTCFQIDNEVCTSPVDASCVPSALDGITLNNTVLDGTVTCDAGTIIDATCIDISNEACPGGDLDIGCIPTDLSSRTLSGATSLTGALVCSGAGAIDANCVSIDGEICSTPITQSCIPSTLTGNTLNNAILDGTVTCDAGTTIDAGCIDISGETCPGGAIGAGCIPSSLMLDTLTVGSIVAENITFMNISITEHIVETTTSELMMVDVLMANQTTLKETVDLQGIFTCSMGGSIDNDCFAIDGETCTTPVDASCLPSTLEGVNFTGSSVLSGSLMCSGGGGISQTCYDISGHSTCSSAIDESCLPSTITNTTLSGSNTLSGTLTCPAPNAIDQMCFQIDGETCTSPIDQSCIPPILNGVTLNNAVLDGTVTCDAGTTISAGCIDISMESCSSPINANCVDISGEVCMAPIDESCTPNTWTEPMTFEGALTLNNTLTCTSDNLIEPSCIDFVSDPVVITELSVGNLTCESPESPTCTAVLVNDRLDDIERELNCSTTSLTLNCHADIDMNDPPTNGDLLTYNATSGLWEPQKPGVQGCPGMKIISGRFRTSPLAEAPMSSEWNVVSLGGGDYRVDYAIPFLFVPSVTITTEKSSSTCAGGIKFGTNIVSSVTMVSTCADAINFVAIGCGDT